MSRGRHAKSSWLATRLFPRRAARRETARLQRVLLRQVADELHHLRALADAQVAAAAEAQERARLAEARTAAAHEALDDLRAEVARLREELAWAWAEGRLPGASVTEGLAGADVIDLRDAAAS